MLDVEITAEQSEVCLDTVGRPVANFLTYSYAVRKGTASNGQMTGIAQYPGPTLNVNPGERLIFTLANELNDLTIRDFYDPAWTPAGEKVPLYPPQLTQSPFNNHTHGLHVSPKGNSDNVLLSIPGGESNTYTYDVPDSSPQGVYWYHSHRHMVTSPHTYLGLTGLLVIGRADGNIPRVTEENLPIQTMNLQYNYVFDRKGGLAQLNNPNWQQYLSTLVPPKPGELEDGSYQPSLTPVNFAESAEGTRFFTPWYTGPLSVKNQRGVFQFMPGNLQTFTADGGQGDIPADPALPDAQRDVQFTVNGQFQPRLSSPPGQTEIWVLANTSDMAYMRVQLTETATGRHPRITIVGQDGNPSPRVHHPATDGGRTLLIPPGNRFAIAATMPESGDLVLEMPPDPSVPAVSTDKQTNFKYPGVAYTNDGSATPPGQLGTITIDPKTVSYWDGFFVYPTQELLRATVTGEPVTGTEFADGQPTNAATSYVDLRNTRPDVKRTMVIRGDFLNKNASKEDPKSFVYAIDNQQFDYAPLVQPRLNSVEQWEWINGNNDEHPMHVHVNDFQVVGIDNPTGNRANPKVIGLQDWGQDVVNVPAPIGFPQEKTGYVPAKTRIRTEFRDFTGTYVLHCHRLNHEDNGLMAIVNVIPEVSTYAISESAAGGTKVRILDGADDSTVAKVTPFPGHSGSVSLAMADVDGDAVLDLVAGAGEGNAPEVVAYSGSGEDPFGTEITRFLAYDEAFRGGISVAAADISGDARADNIIVGSGPGITSEVKVFATELSADAGTAPEVFRSFSPYGDDQRGVHVAAGLLDGMSGRQSIATAPGPGGPATVKVFRYDLFSQTGSGQTMTHDGSESPAGSDPLEVASFEAFDGSYTEGVSLTTGWLAGEQGGVERIIVGQNAAPGTVKVFSSGSGLTGLPTFYLDSPDDHSTNVSFSKSAEFRPFPGVEGVQVATTSTTTGADLLVAGPRGDSTVVHRYALVRPNERARQWQPERISRTATVPGVAAVGGD